MDAKTRLTWYPDSIPRYSSLWFTIQRVAALNCMRLAELPAVTLDSQVEPRLRTDADLLFNESLQPRRPTIDIAKLAALLGERPDVFEWSTLGRVPVWARFLVYPGFRVCPACMAGGYHSALLSLRTLQACPIHGCELLDRCRCGSTFASRLRATTMPHVGQCRCGRFALFTRQGCRAPAMTNSAVEPMTPVTQWLDKLARVIRPSGAWGEYQKADRYSQTWRRSWRQWCDELGLGYPECFVPIPFQPSLHVSRAVASHGWLRHVPVRGEGFDHPRRQSDYGLRYWSNDPVTWTYRAMARHLRRHVALRSEHWVQQFMRLPDPLAIAEHLRTNRHALLAFGEMLWARGIEGLVEQRRWPYRIPRDADGRNYCAAELHLPMPANGLGVDRDKETWLSYQASAAAILALWHRAMRQAVHCARSGIADWTIDWDFHTPITSWAARDDGQELRLFNLSAEVPVDWTLPRRSKAQRVAAEQERHAKQRAAIEAECAGPCLTWTKRNGWAVSVTPTPTEVLVKKHRLLGVGDDRALFWLFPSAGGFIVRLRDQRIQVIADTPRAAIEQLREAVRQHRRTYGNPTTMRRPQPVPMKLRRADRHADELYRNRIQIAGSTEGFWKCQMAVQSAVRQLLLRY